MEHEAALLYKIGNEEARPIRQVRKDVPESLAAVVEKSLEKDPENRYQTPRDLLVVPSAPCLSQAELASITTHLTEGGGRPVQRRVLWLALALLGYRRPEASGHAKPVRHQQGRYRTQRCCRAVSPAGPGLHLHQAIISYPGRDKRPSVALLPTPSWEAGFFLFCSQPSR